MNIMFIFIFVGFVFKWGVDYNLFFFFHFLNKDPFCLNTTWLLLLHVLWRKLSRLQIIEYKKDNVLNKKQLYHDLSLLYLIVLYQMSQIVLRASLIQGKLT